MWYIIIVVLDLYFYFECCIIVFSYLNLLDYLFNFWVKIYENEYKKLGILA
ncbi:Hypothetical protein SFBmNL_00337 [Candidatus Arthromitus sp. SFB-mouse-NL]|nr:Hypothetical protein SFBmNL_00337 [Candidatus Arthromitus sp. SFB-mouse-NL]EGX29236.1 hypothetical protein SFBNYU_012840 [Candidatus Arthromitus sp. SFB-mouse-NYU]